MVTGYEAGDLVFDNATLLSVFVDSIAFFHQGEVTVVRSNKEVQIVEQLIESAEQKGIDYFCVMSDEEVLPSPNW